MRPLSGNDISGNWATHLLPIADDKILYPVLEEQIKFLIEAEVSGIYSNGTAGEFFTQTEEEFDKISGILAELCNAAEMPFQIGCNSLSARGTIERLKRAKLLKPGAVQVILPDWSALSMMEIYRFLDAVCNEANGIGVVLYNPPHAKRIITPEEYMSIIEAGVPLSGCKTAGGDAEWYKKMSSLPNFSFFIPGHFLASGINMGAHGSYSNVACLHPIIAQRWYDMIFQNNTEALIFERRIRAFLEMDILPLIVEKGYSNHAIDKLLCWITGWGKISLEVRWPYLSIPEDIAIVVRASCRRQLPEFFDL